MEENGNGKQYVTEKGNEKLNKNRTGAASTVEKAKQLFALLSDRVTIV